MVYAAALVAILAIVAHASPSPPTGAGYVDTASPANVLPFVDYVYTNVRENPCYVNASTNAGVRILERYLDIWEPTSAKVDAGVTLAASGSCPAVVPSSWTGIPGDSTDGRVLLAAVHNHNLQYCIDTTTARTPAQELSAYLDDRRNKGYSVLDGLGPLTAIWINLTGTTTTITSMPENATTLSYSDAGINVGLLGDANPKFGLATNFVSSMGASGSTEPPKRFFKYARPFRWTKSVILAPHLVPVQSKTPPTDGGFPSGHSAEAVRNGLAIAYLVPQRFQEMVSRAAELGYSRIMSGYHSPLDVMGGARHATGVAAANILANIKANTSAPAFQQAQAQLLAAAGSPLMGFAHSANASTDRFADHNANKALFKFRLTYGFDQIGAKGVPAVVPKGAEVLLETRLPYLTADQIRVVLKSTAVDSGYPLLDDSEGWGRLNLFDAADGYGRFDGDVIVTMDGSLGGFHASDSWNNDISGPGLLKKLGSGALRLTGANTFTGGIHLSAGSLTAASKTAFGTGPVYADGGNIYLEVPVQVGGLTMLKSSGLTIEMPTANDGLQAAGSVYLDGASLTVKLGYVPAAGDSIVLVNGKDLTGTFASVTVEGVAGVVSYTSSQVIFTIPRASASSVVTVTASSTSSQAIASVSGARNENGSSYQPAPLTNLYMSGASSLSMLSAVAALTVLFF
ncbi:hypothetical protein HDU77_009261 [Chytriomyces hyalinus]|nr:hypothetical protein HDU77_009261 [Chytriomyces hyalinus]